MQRPTLALRLRRSLEKVLADVGIDAASSPFPPFETSFALDLSVLLAHALQPQKYGLYLGQQLFADPQIRAGWDLLLSQRREDPICLRLILPADDPALHSIRWELLQVPGSAATAADDSNAERHIALRTDVVIVRTVEETTVQEPSFAQHADLRALVVIANPKDIETYGLSPIDEEDWAAQARALLGDCSLTIVGQATGAHRPTFTTLSTLLNDGYDILYLVCHGTMTDGEAYLWLEGQYGKAHQVPGAQLVPAITGVAKPPRLVVLAACNSAGAGQAAVVTPTEGSPLDSASLAHQLSQHGIRATVAMQGPLQLGSAGAFFSTFFTGLFSHRDVDRAVSEGRRAISQADWWVPVLFLQQQDVKLWHPLRLEDITLDWPERDRLVGRVEEHSKVMAAIDRGETVILIGEEGIGKRTLLTHIARRASEEGPRHLFWLSSELNTDIWGVMKRLVTFVGRRTGRAFEASLSIARLTPLSVWDWVTEGLRTLRPLLVFSEVDHLWKDRDFQILLNRLVPLVRDKTITVLLSAEDVPDVGNQSSWFLLRLERLSPSDILAVIAANKWPLPARVGGEIERLHSASDGNPLLLQLLTCQLAIAADPLATLTSLAATQAAAEDLAQKLTQTLSPNALVILAALNILSDSPATREVLAETVGELEGAHWQLDETLQELCATGLVRRIADAGTTAVYRLRRFQRTQGLVAESDVEGMHRRASTHFISSQPFFAAVHLARIGAAVEAAQLVVNNLLAIIEGGHLRRADTLIKVLPLDTLDPELSAQSSLAQAKLRLIAAEGDEARQAAAAAELRASVLTDASIRHYYMAEAALVRAAVHISRGEYGAAARIATAQLASSTRDMLPAGVIARLYAELADALYQDRRKDEASTAIAEGLAIVMQAPGLLIVRARLLMRRAMLGQSYRDSEPLQLYAEVLDLARAAADFELVARIHYNRGVTLDDRGVSVSALAEYEASRTLAQQIGAEVVLAYTLFGIGQHYAQREEREKALDYLVQARDRFEKLKLFPAHARAIINIGELYFYSGQYDAAQEQMRQAAAFSRLRGKEGSELRMDTAIAEYWLGEIALVQRRAKDGLRHAERALPRFQKLEALNYEVMVHRLQGDCFLALNDLERAAAAIAAATSADEKVGDPFDHMAVLVSRARLAAAQGQPDEPRWLLEEAQECLADTPSPHHERLIQNALTELL